MLKLSFPTSVSKTLKSKSTALCKATTKKTGLIDIHPIFKHVVRCQKPLQFLGLKIKIFAFYLHIDKFANIKL